MKNITLSEEKTIELGDKRLTKRYEKIIKATLQNPACSFPAIVKNWHQLKAVYRFLKNPKVTPEKLLLHQKEATIDHIKALEDQKDILLLQDTTDLNYNNHTSKEELQKTHAFIHRGLRIHPTIAVTPNKINLGLMHAKIWTREETTPEQKKEKIAL